MDQGPLVNDQIEAGKNFVQLFEKYAPLKAAFWLKDSEYGHWFLHLASDAIDTTTLGVAYGEVVRLAASMPDPKIDVLQVKLVVRNESLVRAVEELQRRRPGRAIRHSGLLGDVNVEEVYVYPMSVAAA